MSRTSTTVKIFSAVMGLFLVTACLTGCQSLSEKHALATLEKSIQHIARQAENSVVVVELTTRIVHDADSVQVMRRFGSGFVYQDEYVVTTEGFVGVADSVWVITQMGGRIPAILVGKDFETNVAVLKVPNAGLTPVSLKSSPPPNGSLGILLGNTYYSEGMACGWGVVNQTWIGGGDFMDDKLLSVHIDWPGLHSGTPLLDVQGDLIGIAEGHLEDFETAWTIIPSNTLSIVAEKLILEGSISRGWLGIRSNPICPREKTARLMKQWKGKGAVVSSLVTDSPADQAGFAVGDVVTEVNGETVLCISDLRRMLTAMAPGTSVVVSVNRDGETFTREIVLGSVPDDPQRQRRCIRRSA